MEIVPGKDGNIVTEISMMELIARDMLVEDSMHPFGCKVREDVIYSCLDVGAPSTWKGLIDPTQQNDFISSNPSFDFSVASVANVTDIVTFGQSRVCSDNKVTGDGIVNVFDIATMLAYLFRDSYGVQVYPNVDMRELSTVQGRTGLADLCEVPKTREEYVREYAQNTCGHLGDPVVRRRRLEERPSTVAQAYEDLPKQDREPLLLPWSPPSANISWSIGLQQLEVTQQRDAELPQLQYVLYHGDRLVSGVWYTLTLSALTLTIEVTFRGLNGLEADLSMSGYDGSAPLNPEKPQVRYTRLCQYSSAGCDNTCSSIDPAGTRALAHGALGLTQSNPFTACPFDIHIWVPFTHSSSDCVGVNYIIVANGDTGLYNGQTSCAIDALSILPPPPPTAPLAAFTPPVVSITIFSVSTASLCCCCCWFLLLFLLRRKRKREDEEQLEGRQLTA